MRSQADARGAAVTIAAKVWLKGGDRDGIALSARALSTAAFSAAVSNSAKGSYWRRRRLPVRWVEATTEVGLCLPVARVLRPLEDRPCRKALKGMTAALSCPYH